MAAQPVRAAVLAFLLLLARAVTMSAAEITLVPVATGLDNPVAVTNANDGSGRLFISLQDGRVLVHDGCVTLITPFLDIRSLVLSGGERGLLSIAFHPAFLSTPYFYVYYTRQPDGAIVIARYRVSSGNRNVADPASAAFLLVIPHPNFSNHNGGQLQFGPDGYLYIGTGDGGSANDPACNAQNNDTLLGRLLRIDVNANFNTSPFYGVPASNPSGVGPPTRETWAKGLRNPWRFSFDRSTGDLLSADVGQGAREEVDFQPAGVPGGRNYGWKIMEGTLCTGNTGGCTGTVPACNHPSLTLPIFDYSHSAGRCSITGGYRYRGSQVPGLGGTYVHGDFCTGEIFQATESGGVWTPMAGPTLDTTLAISSFGEDEAGELYVTDHTTSGGVYRIVAPARQADLSVTKTDGTVTTFPGDTLTYSIVVGNAGPVAAYNANVTDMFPASLQNVNWTCSASAGSTCCSIVGGNAFINRPVALLPGGTVTYTATATVSGGASGSLSNTATVTAPAGVTDPNAGNNSATDTDTVMTTTDLSITKTDGQIVVSPGQVVTYAIVASNLGPNVASGAAVTDTVPAALTAASWICAGANGGTCSASGSGSISDSVHLPAGASVTYTLTGTVAADPPSLQNTARIAAPATVHDPDPSNNSATDVDFVNCVDIGVVVPDGRRTRGTLAAGAIAWFASSLQMGSSYSAEFGDPATAGAAPTLTVFRGDDGCTGTTTAEVRDTASMDPVAGAAARVSFTALGTDPVYRFRLENTSGTALAYGFIVGETGLYSPAWTTSGTYDTYYSLQNTTRETVTGTITLTDTSGVVVGTSSLTIPPGQTASTNTVSLGVAGDGTGTARFVHDGPPGAVLATAAIANFTFPRPYVQPVKFESVREAR